METEPSMSGLHGSKRNQIEDKAEASPAQYGLVCEQPMVGGREQDPKDHPNEYEVIAIATQ
jgi:hypothetical protein